MSVCACVSLSLGVSVCGSVGVCARLRVEVSVVTGRVSVLGGEVGAPTRISGCSQSLGVGAPRVLVVNVNWRSVRVSVCSIECAS